VSRTALVDALYEAFVGTLPAELRGEARGLACALGLARSNDALWSEVVEDPITLGAPLLVADAMPTLGGAVIDDAMTAHLLAVIAALGAERRADVAHARTPSLSAVLDHVTRARDAARARVIADEALAYDEAADDAREALAEQRRIFAAERGIDLARYLAVTQAKRRHGGVASLALARAAGWEPRRRQSLARALDAVGVAQALLDDVMRWEGDHARGGAWAVALACGASRLARDEGASARGAVLGSGVLARMLFASARSFGAARRRATALGAPRLAAWAREREASVHDLAQHEAASPGFTGRGRALSAWARTAAR
jgi:hypothetical protein